MKLSYNTCLKVAFAFFLGACFQLTNGNYNAIQRLEEVIEMAERESRLLANEINQWLIQESGGMIKEDEKMHLRSTRSVDDFDEGAQTDADLLSEVSRPIVRRDIAKNKNLHNKGKGSVVVKKEDKKSGGVFSFVEEARFEHQNGQTSSKEDVTKEKGRRQRERHKSFDRRES